MRLFLAVLALAAIAPVPLAAQTRYSFGAGLTGGTKFLEDRIFEDITVEQKPAPTFTVGVSTAVSARERAGIELSLGLGKTRIKESGQPEVDGPDFKTLGMSVGVDGPIIKMLRYRIGAGLIKYFPDKEAFFRQGGPLLLTLALGADVPVYRTSSLGLVGRVRYDYQRFSTDELRTAGFSRTQDVHRLGLGLAIEYSR